MPTLPTVRVKSPHPEHVQGFYIINESDFDPNKHELWEEDNPDAGKAGQPSAAIEHGAESERADAAKAAYAAKAAEPRPVTLDRIAEDKAHRKPHPVNDQKLHLPMYERKGQP
jgi:hypothetical protein